MQTQNEQEAKECLDRANVKMKEEDEEDRESDYEELLNLLDEDLENRNDPDIKQEKTRLKRKKMQKPKVPDDGHITLEPPKRGRGRGKGKGKGRGRNKNTSQETAPFGRGRGRGKGRGKGRANPIQDEDAVPTKEEIAAAFSEEPCPSNKPSEKQLSEIAQVFGLELAQELQDLPTTEESKKDCNNDEVASLFLNSPVPEECPKDLPSHASSSNLAPGSSASQPVPPDQKEADLFGGDSSGVDSPSTPPFNIGELLDSPQPTRNVAPVSPSAEVFSQPACPEHVPAVPPGNPQLTEPCVPAVSAEPVVSNPSTSQAALETLEPAATLADSQLASEEPAVAAVLAHPADEAQPSVPEAAPIDSLPDPSQRVPAPKDPPRRRVRGPNVLHTPACLAAISPPGCDIRLNGHLVILQCFCF